MVEVLKLNEGITINGEQGQIKISELVVGDIIGKGKFAYVHKCWDEKSELNFAVKVVRLDYDDEDAQREILNSAKNEAYLLSLCSHHSIPKFYSFWENEDMIYIVMEYVNGSDLQKFLDDKIEMSLKEKVGITRDAAFGYHHIHKKGWIVCDIKPNAIKVDVNDKVYILDFNIAQPISFSDILKLNDIIPGTPYYMSPEATQGLILDQRSDIFSLGSTFYQSLSSKYAFQGNDLYELFYQIRECDPRPLRDHNSEIPSGLQDVVDKALKKRKLDRFQSMEEFADALNEQYKKI